MVLSVEPNRAPVTRIELTGEFQDAVWSRGGDFLAILTATAKPGSVPASGCIELRRASSLNEIEREVRLPFLPVHLAWHPSVVSHKRLELFSLFLSLDGEGAAGLDLLQGLTAAAELLDDGFDCRGPNEGLRVWFQTAMYSWMA